MSMIQQHSNLNSEAVLCKHQDTTLELSEETTTSLDGPVAGSLQRHKLNSVKTGNYASTSTQVQGYESAPSQRSKNRSRRSTALPIRYRSSLTCIRDGTSSPLKHEVIPVMTNSTQLFTASATNIVDTKIESLCTAGHFHTHKTARPANVVGFRNLEVSIKSASQRHSPKDVRQERNRITLHSGRTFGVGKQSSATTTKPDVSENIDKKIKRQRISAELDRDLALMKLPYSDPAVAEYLYT